MGSRNFHGKRNEVAEQIGEMKDTPTAKLARAAFDALPAAVAGEGDVQVNVETNSDSHSAFVNAQARVQLPRT